MRYRQLAGHAYSGAAGSVSKMESQQEKTFCVLRVEVTRSVITVQREFRARFKKDPPHKNNVFIELSVTNVTHEINTGIVLNILRFIVYVMFSLFSWYGEKREVEISLSYANFLNI
jgi:hypothetical protein